jgi:hypothetical protein
MQKPNERRNKKEFFFSSHESIVTWYCNPFIPSSHISWVPSVTRNIFFTINTPSAHRFIILNWWSIVSWSISERCPELSPSDCRCW